MPRWMHCQDACPDWRYEQSRPALLEKMNLDELGAPLIVYWDINPQLPIDPQIIRRICDNLLTNRIFMLNLWDPSSYLSAGASIILECLKNENINNFLIGISFPVSNQTFENIPDALSLCVKAGTKDIYFPIQRPEEDRKIFWPDTEKRRQVSEKVKSVVTDGLNIIVHH